MPRARPGRIGGRAPRRRARPTRPSCSRSPWTPPGRPASSLRGAGPGRPSRSTPSPARSTSSPPSTRASEELIVGRLLGARPDDGVLGEEGAARPGTSGVRWVVDPIDGTVNFLYGLAAYAVCIAAEVDGGWRPAWCSTSPTGELFTAVRGRRGVPGRRRRRAGAAAVVSRRRWTRRWWPPGSATAPSCAARRARSSPSCCRGSRDIRRRGVQRARPVLGGRRPAGRATTSSGSSPGTTRPAGWSPPRPARCSAGCTAGRSPSRWRSPRRRRWPGRCSSSLERLHPAG